MIPAKTNRWKNRVMILVVFGVLMSAFGCAPVAPTPTATPTETPTPAASPTPTDDSTPTPLPFGYVPVRANADWTPVEQDFDGVVMVMVPAGCFIMGSTGINSNEQPEHQQCIDAPFWIDKTEVTNAQFAQFGGEAAEDSRWERDFYPRESLTVFEAVAFCEKRDARLTTEREWEYAARGPDSLTYPWGNDWDENRLVWKDNSGDRSGVVGNYPDSASWVGALDMSGNVWEWTTSLDRPYPYVVDDGREAAFNTRTFHMARGGSWINDNPYQFTTSMRQRTPPTLTDSIIGFRCARDYLS
jgi:formylglycine-generating enzyme required for sulfatase activity